MIDDNSFTLSSGIEKIPMTLDISVFPKRPSWPCNFSPVKVLAIFQNLICPEPAVTKWLDMNFENSQMCTSWVWDLVLKIIFEFFQSQIVRIKSELPPWEHKYVPSSLWNDY